MSEATTWAKAQRVGNPGAKTVLEKLASWADADGYVWALVPVLAFECERSERFVQRGLAWLRDLKDSPLEVTERKHLRDGKLIPVYRLRLENGPSNTREAMKAARGGRGLGVTLVSPQDGASGDTGVTPRGDIGDMLGVTPASPHLLRVEIEAEGEEEAGAREAAFEVIFSAWSKIAPDRVSRPRDRSAFEAVCEVGHAADAVAAAGVRFLGSSRDVKDRRVMALEKWLIEQRFEPWMGVGASPEQPLRTQFADAEVRSAFAAAKGEEFAASYIDPARWRDADRTIVARTRHAFIKLTTEAGHVLRSLNVTVVEPELV